MDRGERYLDGMVAVPLPLAGVAPDPHTAAIPEQHAADAGKGAGGSFAVGCRGWVHGGLHGTCWLVNED